MGKTGLKLGILFLIFGFIIGVTCLLLPPLTNNRIRWGESAFGLIPAAVLVLLGLSFTIHSTIFNANTKKSAELYKSQLQPENIIFLEEKINGSMTFRNFHRPGSYSGWRKISISAMLALTQKRLLALEGSKPIIDVSLNDPRLRQMKFSLEGEDKLCVAFDANLFQPDWSGEIEYRFKTPKAQEFLPKLNEITGRV